MTMPRTLEAELMDAPEQAQAYAQADFTEVNAGFVTGFLARFPQLPDSARILDLGCGPADIPIRLARALPQARIQAVEGAAAMVELAATAVDQASLGDHITVVHTDLQSLRPVTPPFQAVISNSLLHHLAEPHTLWERLRQQALPGAAIYIMDLQRPESEQQAAAIVATYAEGEPEQLRRDFYNSLRAAFTPEEVGSQLRSAGLDTLRVESVSDRHLLVSGLL